MQFSTSSIVAIASLALSQVALAADCYNGGGNNCMNRDQLYKYRQQYCANFSWVGQPGGITYYSEGGKTVKFTNWGAKGMTQQQCWDSTQNIIDQCLGHQSAGKYDYNGWTQYINFCS